MKPWKFWVFVILPLVLIIVATLLLWDPAFFMLEKIGIGLAVFFKKAWIVILFLLKAIWWIIKVIVAIAFAALMVAGPFFLGVAITNVFLPSIDEATDENFYFKTWHYWVVGILASVVIGGVAEALMIFGTYIQPIAVLVKLVHPHKFASPGVWEVYPIFWPIWGFITSAIGMLFGYEE